MRIVINITFAIEIFISGTTIFLSSYNIKETIRLYFHQIVTKMKILTIIVRNMISVRFIFYLIITLKLRELVDWILLETACPEQP